MPPHLAALLLASSFWPVLGVAELAAVLLVGAATILWIVSSASNLEKVWAWLTAGRRAREAKVNSRLDDIENEMRAFVGEDTLNKQFEDGRERHRRLVETVRVLQGAQHEAVAQHEALKNEVRRNQQAITELGTLNPRLTKTESDVLLLLQQMQQLKEGQNEIKQRLDKVADESHEDRDAILQAIRNLKS